MKDNSEVEGVVPVSKGDAHPEIASSRILESDCVASAAVHSLDDGLFIVGGHFGLSEQLALLIDEGYFDDSIFLCDFDASLPDHFLPVVEVVALGGGEGRDLEDGDAFGFVAEDQLGGLHCF